MAREVGVTAEIITGITKDSMGNISGNKHSWIFVYTHSYEGILLDPTWGAGALDGARYIKNEDNSIWFNVSPYRMIFSHYPDQQCWTKLDIPITTEQFEKLQLIPISNDDAEYKNRLFECLSKID